MFEQFTAQLGHFFGIVWCVVLVQKGRTVMEEYIISQPSLVKSKNDKHYLRFYNNSIINIVLHLHYLTISSHWVPWYQTSPHSIKKRPKFKTSFHCSAIRLLLFDYFRCSPGYYSSSVGSNTCRPCKMGTFAAKSG